MNNDDIMNNLNNIINSGQIPDNIKEMLNNISNSKNKENQSENIKQETDSSSINPEMISNILNILGKNNTQSSTSSGTTNSSIDMEMLMKMKTIMDKMNSNNDDPRANLLLSLKPYLKESRKEKVDQYAKLFKMSNVMELFNSTGGESKKWCLFIPFLIIEILIEI